MLNAYAKIALLFLILLLATFYSCSDNKVSGSSLLDANGLTKDINDIVPDSLLEIIKAYGMPINTGDSPPSIEGAYLVSPFILDSSNIESDVPGTTFSPFYLNFTGQKKIDLTVNVDYVNGGEVGIGIGSYIVGEGGDFSVFSKVTTTYSTDSAYVLFLFSGNKQSDGIHGMQVAVFMLDDLGDPSGYFIENNQGRIFYESDNFSDPIDWYFSKQSAIKPDGKAAVTAQN